MLRQRLLVTERVSDTETDTDRSTDQSADATAAADSTATVADSTTTDADAGSTTADTTTAADADLGDEPGLPEERPLSEFEAADFADFEPGDWRRYDLEEIEALDFSKVPDSALPTDTRCPRCHWPVFVETVQGPGHHSLRPCGCRVGLVER